jgi:hypothetical protein
MNLTDSDLEKLRTVYMAGKRLENEPRLAKQLEKIRDVRDHLEKAVDAWRDLSDSSKRTIAFMQHASGGPWEYDPPSADDPEVVTQTVPIDEIVSRMECDLRNLESFHEAFDLTAWSLVDSGGRPPRIALRNLSFELIHHWVAAGGNLTTNFDGNTELKSLGREAVRHIDPDVLNETTPRGSDPVDTIFHEEIKRYLAKGNHPQK